MLILLNLPTVSEYRPLQLLSLVNCSGDSWGVISFLKLSFVLFCFASLLTYIVTFPHKIIVWKHPTFLLTNLEATMIANWWNYSYKLHLVSINIEEHLFLVPVGIDVFVFVSFSEYIITIGSVPLGCLQWRRRSSRCLHHVHLAKWDGKEDWQVRSDVLRVESISPKQAREDDALIATSHLPRPNSIRRSHLITKWGGLWPIVYKLLHLNRLLSYQPLLYWHTFPLAKSTSW